MRRALILALLASAFAFGVRADTAAPEPGAGSSYADVEGSGDVLAGLAILPSMLPPPPAGYRRRSFEEADYVVPSHFVDELPELERTRARNWQRIVDELGVVPLERVVVRIARKPEEMHAMAPRGLPPPSYASGVAYPSLGLVLLTLTTHDPEEPVPNLPQVLTHELSHVALHRAAGSRPIPRWFSEGMAIHQSGENTLPRIQTLWEAASRRRLLPMHALSTGFADGGGNVDVAYAQSADVVAFLLRENHGPDKMRRMLTAIRDGRTFEQALEGAFFFDLPELDRAWRADLDERHSSIPLVLGGGGVWAIGLVALAIGYVRKRRRNRAVLDRWANQEAAIDSLEAELQRKLEAAERERRRRLAEVEASTAVDATGPTTGGGAAATERGTEGTPDDDDALPHVESNGEKHTLH